MITATNQPSFQCTGNRKQTTKRITPETIAENTVVFKITPNKSGSGWRSLKSQTRNDNENGGSCVDSSRTHRASALPVAIVCAHAFWFGLVEAARWLIPLSRTEWQEHSWIDNDSYCHQTDCFPDVLWPRTIIRKMIKQWSHEDIGMRTRDVWTVYSVHFMSPSRMSLFIVVVYLETLSMFRDDWLGCTLWCPQAIPIIISPSAVGRHCEMYSLTSTTLSLTAQGYIFKSSESKSNSSQVNGW